MDFVISEADMEILKGLPQIEDYGDASLMPVYGGKLTVGSVLTMMWRSVLG